MINNLYAIDFYAWTQEQAKLLRDRQWHELDLPNLIEEIESLGKQQRQELRNRLSILIGHLLKWRLLGTGCPSPLSTVEYQPQRRSRSWLSTIRVQRREIQQLLQENPSLKSYLQEAVLIAYQNGKDLAVGETNLPNKTFPAECTYTLEDILSDRFFPGEPYSE
ncbi:DUF29 domain-containing protein [Gloeocapsopsis sp. IPPAS B-1203]|uniref:DUF29 domain-containing protein n=1 Tax=Gloeocapsopsis sp. IPPAS B-1203 TaxID=2049454 RepID=UPI000C196EC2|nr:DUF29 domain-containing protein [Gloeocapsopsis sp. IPPAS B-1203]PIG93191.1 hypothetical protein CSQ79_13425 [Gloeocapsopsis sp. IPPAS B-1203]